MAYDPSVSWPTLATLTNRMEPGGKIAKIAEAMEQTNTILEDVPFIECNQGLHHMTTVRTDVPSGTWRKLNYGISATKSGTAQITDSCGLLENRSEIDLVLARINGNTAEFRASEELSTIQGLNNQLATTFFYGDTSTYPERFLGFAPRYDALTLTGKITANNYLANIINNGGSTANVQTSIWLVVWGDQTVHGLYPKGSPGGLEAQDLGEIDLHDADGGVFRGYATHYRVQQGMTVRDWRYVVRICNVETTATLSAAIADKILDSITDAMHAVPNLNMGRAAFYCNRATMSYLAKLERRPANARINYSEVYGKKNVMNVEGVPIRQNDAILSTEAVIS